MIHIDVDGNDGESIMVCSLPDPVVCSHHPLVMLIKLAVCKVNIFTKHSA